MIQSSRTYEQSPFVRAVPVAAVLCAVVDAGIVSAISSSESMHVRVEHVAYLVGHRFLIGALLWGICTLYVRWARPRLGARPNADAVAASVMAALFLAPLFYPDFERQWWPFAAANLIATWLVFTTLAVFVRVEHLWSKLRYLPAIGFVVTCAHYFVLPYSLSEIHIALTVFEICLMATLLRRRIRFDETDRRARRLGLLVFAALGIASVVIRPPFLAAAELAKDPGTVLPLLTPLYAAPEPDRRAIALVSDPKWFERRSPDPPAAPSGPPASLFNPTVILFTIDAVRYEVFATKRAEVMPHLDALAKESCVFSHAYSTATATAPSLSSVVSGHFFSQADWELGSYPRHALAFPDAKARALPTIATRLQDAHVATFWAPPMGRLDQSWGIVRGFAEEIPAANGEIKTGAELSHEVVAWLSRHRHQSTFAFTHILEPHSPYSGQGTTPYQRYLGDVTSADTVLGNFIDTLRAQGMWDHTILIVSADHGESFGEHGQTTHGGLVYDELVHVPLIIHFPPKMAGVVPHSIDEPVSLIDLGPTILEIFGVPVPGDNQGQSLLPWLRGETPQRSAVLAFDTPAEGVTAARGSRGMIFRDGIKAMWSRHAWRYELYDLARDPNELHNLADERSDALKRLGVLVDFFSIQAER